MTCHMRPESTGPEVPPIGLLPVVAAIVQLFRRTKNGSESPVSYQYIGPAHVTAAGLVSETSVANGGVVGSGKKTPLVIDSIAVEPPPATVVIFVGAAVAVDENEISSANATLTVASARATRSLW